MKQNKNRLSFQAHLSRHPHDVSAGYTSSLTTGCIVPQYFDILQPGDKMKFKTHMFARFQDVVTAFLGEVDIHVDYFFVPMQMIYTPFGQIFAQTNDVLTSQLKTLGSKDTFPLLFPNAFFGGAKNQDKLPGHVECRGKELVRFLDSLDLNPYIVVGADARSNSGFVPSEVDPALLDDSLCKMPNISPWILGAYQAIYQKYYRNDEFERFDIESYNIDQYYSQDKFVNYKFTQLRYVQRPKDYFTQLRPSPIASAVDKLASDISYTQFPYQGSRFENLFLYVNNYLGVSPSANSYVNFQKAGEALTPGIQGIDAADLGSAVSPGMQPAVSNIRAAFALDKFLRIYGRAGKTYDDQILAHFGVEIPHDVKHDLTHIKHYRVVVQSDPVYGTATIGTDTGSVLGQVGGQAQGSLDTDVESFTAPVHGVFMAVAYAVTKPRYFGTFNKLHLLDSRLKFPIPEFDKLGAQPMYAFEATPWKLAEYTVDLESEFVDSYLQLFRCGWQNRYAEFKQKYNRVSINYAPSWYFGSGQDLEQQNNDFMPWVLTRAPYGNMQLDDDDIHNVWAEEFFERPDALNSVMAVEYNPDWSRDYYFAPHLINQTDPLITEFFCDATKISWMSETGDPDL